MITHDIDEAVFLSDRVLIMSQNQGHIESDTDIDLGRPRDRRDEKYHRLTAELTSVLQNINTERRLEEKDYALSGIISSSSSSTSRSGSK